MGRRDSSIREQYNSISEEHHSTINALEVQMDQMTATLANSEKHQKGG